MGLCENCGHRESVRQQCNGDGGDHWHGKVHSILRGSTNDLMALCQNCWQFDRRMWEKHRKSTDPTLETYLQGDV